MLCLVILYAETFTTFIDSFYFGYVYYHYHNIPLADSLKRRPKDGRTIRVSK